MAFNISFRIKKNTFVNILLFFVYPLGSLPFLIKAMIRREKYAFILFGIFMGLIGILVPPTGDFYRYTEDAQIIKDLNWQDFLIYASLKFDFLLIFLSYLLTHLDINFDVSRFIYNSISYILLGLLYLKIVNTNKYISKKDNWILLLIFMPFAISTFLFRFFFSEILFLYGSYEIIFFKKKKGWLFVILSIFSHITYIIFFVGLILWKFKILNFNRKFVLILCLSAVLINSDIMIKLLNFLPIDMMNHFMVYLDGYWAGDFLQDHSFRYQLMMMLNSAVVYSGIIIYYYIYNFISKKNIGLANYMLLIVVLTTPFVTINGRFMEVFFINFKTLFLKYYNINNKIFQRTKYILLCLVIVSTFSSVWSFRKQIALGDFEKLLYSSFPSLISQTYTQSWINTHVFDDGGFVQ